MWLVSFPRESRVESTWQDSREAALFYFDRNGGDYWNARIQEKHSVEVLIPGGRRTVRFELPTAAAEDKLPIIGDWNNLERNLQCGLIENRLQETCVPITFVLYRPFDGIYYNV